MDDAMLAQGVYQSLSHWGLFDSTIRDGVVRIQCDSDGTPVSHVFEHLNDVLPLLVVEYQDRGFLIIMGDHATGLIRDRIWHPDTEGAMPPRDEFTSGMQQFEQAPANVTRH